MRNDFRILFLQSLQYEALHIRKHTTHAYPHEKNPSVSVRRFNKCAGELLLCFLV
jgi:hypothetical protein